MKGTQPPPGARDDLDAVSLLRVVAVLLVIIPSNMVVGPVGAVGTPANLLALFGLVWWFSTLLAPQQAVAAGFQPVRLALLAFYASILASYVAAMRGPVTAQSVSGADRGLLTGLVLIGLGLLAADGIRSAARLNALLKTVLTAGTVLALTGMLQFATGTSMQLERLTSVGLHQQYPVLFVQDRAGFPRVSGTTTHPIEFGVVVGMLLPLALHFFFTEQGRRRYVPVLALFLAIPVTLSRSTIVAAAAAALVYVPTWSRARAWKTFLLVLLGVAVIRVLRPGLVGSFVSLFTNAGNDPSTTRRAERYGLAKHFIGEHLWFGRGFKAFLPEQYLYFDNQYVTSAIETGMIGVAVLVSLVVIGFFTARGARRMADTAVQRSLAQALAASIAASAVSFATFDVFAYPVAAGLTFLLVGCAGALWRLQGGEGASDLRGQPADLSADRSRRLAA